MPCEASEGTSDMSVTLHQQLAQHLNLVRSQAWPGSCAVVVEHVAVRTDEDVAGVAGDAMLFVAREGPAVRVIDDDRKGQAFLRHVLADTDGDVWPATHTAIGRYWRDVLS